MKYRNNSLKHYNLKISERFLCVYVYSRIDGFLFLFNLVNLFAFVLYVPFFFSEPTRFYVGFKTWLIFSDAVVHTGESSRNLFKQRRGLIVFTTFRLVLNQLDIRFVSNRSKCIEQNLLCVFLSVYLQKIVCLI